MTQELFNILPSEIIINILLKLPVRTITICKCVCKSWLHLVESPEFVKSHLSTSVSGLVTFETESSLGTFKLFEVEDGLHYNLVAKSDFAYGRWMRGSVDGLLWMRDPYSKSDSIFIGNPITRDCIRIQTPLESPYKPNRWVTCGFGSCKMTGQYKVVWILLEKIFGRECEKTISIVECRVYTLGMGSGWRRLASCALDCVPPKDKQPGAFVNGNLHWLGCDLEDYLWISCFDLETESFSTISTPPLLSFDDRQLDLMELFALGGSLCLCDSPHGGEIIIWLMEEYGIDESWTKTLVINRDLGGYYESELRFHPIEVFKDGDILMEKNSKIFYYSSKTKSIQQLDMFKGNNFPDMYRIIAISHTPSFRLLKSFEMENVSFF